MTRMATRLVLLILGAIAPSFKAALAVEPIAIYISGPTDIVKPGSDLVIHIVLINRSDNDIDIPRIVNDSDAELNYSIKVRNEKNDAAPDTKYGELMKSKQTIGSRMAITLHSNESTAPETAIINRLFLLTPGHTYTVQVQREFPSGSGTWVKSNSIKFELGK
jgi:hypothetical protein